MGIHKDAGGLAGTHRLEQWFLTGGDFTPFAPRYLAMFRENFGCHNWEIGNHYLVDRGPGARDTVKYLIMTGLLCPLKNHPTQKVSRAQG